MLRWKDAEAALCRDRIAILLLQGARRRALRGITLTFGPPVIGNVFWWRLGGLFVVRRDVLDVIGVDSILETRHDRRERPQ